MTTIDVTDEQIRALEIEAAKAGDMRQVAICAMARGAQHPGGMTREQARAECARVIADARAQSDDD